MGARPYSPQRLLARLALGGLLSCSLTVPVLAQEEKAPSNEELARRIEILAGELEDLQHPGVTRGPESQFGLGPAASKVYTTPSGVSLAGYGEVVYQNFAQEREDGSPSGARDRIDFLRQILYVGYVFDEHVLFNSEIEFEHASTGKNGEVALEFAYVDFLVDRTFNARAGMLLVPMGFVNLLHEPPVFFGVDRPEIERRILPSTWRANGAGVFGEGRGQLEGFSYQAYAIESLASVKGSGGSGEAFSASGVRGGRQSGSKAVIEDVAGVFRADYERHGALVGGSIFFGQTGQGAADSLGNPIDGFTTIWEAHAQIRHRGAHLRALVAGADIGDAAAINAANGLTGNAGIGSQLLGWYVEAAYDVLPALYPEGRWRLAPYVRVSQFDTQSEVPAGFLRNPANDRTRVTAGVAFFPHPQVVVKTDYLLDRNEADTGVDRWNLALGYLF